MSTKNASLKAAVIADLLKNEDEFSLSAKYRIQTNTIHKWGVEIGVFNAKKKSSKETYINLWKTMKMEGKSQTEIHDYIQAEFGVSSATIKRVLHDQPDFVKAPRGMKDRTLQMKRAFELYKENRTIDEIVNDTKFGKARVQILVDAWKISA
jgi:hypothetical protein